MAHRLLLVEDDRAFRRVYGPLIRSAGYELVEAEDRPSARRAWSEGPFAAAIVDLMLPPDGTAEGGLALLAELRAERPSAKLIVASGAGDVPTMLAAVKSGAYDFLTKPVDPDVLLVVIARAVQRFELERQLESLHGQLDARDGMIGRSGPFRSAVELAERVAASELPVLITGENGTGKELLARAVHLASRRRDRRFVPLNCGAIPSGLLESTMFGHDKGAFTGASRDHAGVFEEADGGTLFLDELAELPIAMQPALLRALESGEIRRVGGAAAKTVDVRLVSATHQDLSALVAKGELREDIYWRIRGAEIRLPALRERREDLPLLAQHFLQRAAHLARDGRPKALDDAALDAMLAHPWPGNIRELKHEMQRATVMAGDRSAIFAEDLSFFGSSEGEPRPAPSGASLPAQVEALERREIKAALERSAGNRSRAAIALGLSRQGLLKKMDRYGIG